MSIHTFPADTPAGLLVEECAARLRTPEQALESDGRVTLTFTPDLSPAEIDLLLAIVARLRAGVTMSPQTFEALLPTLTGLRDYHALPSPTGAQTVAAVKGLIRVVRAMLREA